MAWASWAIPLLFAEALIRMRSTLRLSRAAAKHVTPGAKTI
jgi:hypothetical protein